jgi:hypothetical protein
VSSRPRLPLRLVEVAQEPRQAEQIRGTERRPSGGKGDGWVWRNDVRPGGRQRAQGVVLVEEPDPLFTPGTPDVEEFELASKPGMEGMRDAEVVIPFMGTRCN